MCEAAFLSDCREYRHAVHNTACRIACTHCWACCCPPHEIISFSCGNSRGQGQCLTMNLGLAWRCTDTSVGVKGDGISLLYWIGITALGASIDNTSASLSWGMLCTAVLLIFSRLCVWAVLMSVFEIIISGKRNIRKCTNVYLSLGMYDCMYEGFVCEKGEQEKG